MRCLISLILGCCLASATAAPAMIPAAPQLATEGHILLDAVTGTVLVEENADMRLAPASLTKIMTSYVIAAEV